MRILVTGCAGFIGWKTSIKFLDGKHEVFGIDDLNDYYDVRLKKWRLGELRSRKNFTFKKTDIRETGSLEKIFSGFKPEVVVNLAARAGVRASILAPSIYFQTNVIGNLNLLELSRKYKVPKYILSSTSSLYACQKMPFAETCPVNEPISPYAASKKGAEVTCYTYHYLYGLDVTVFRFFTVYGPAGRPDMSVFKFIKLIDEGKKITVYGDGTQTRDFTYVDDIARGTALGIKKTGFEIINLGNDDPHELNEMISIIEMELGKKARILYKPFHPTDLKATWADIEKAKKLLGWKPSIDLKEGLKLTVGWYLENKNSLKDVILPD